MEAQFNETVMNELLSIPEIKENVDKMTEGELKFYKLLLVREGIYGRFETFLTKEKKDVPRL